MARGFSPAPPSLSPLHHFSSPHAQLLCAFCPSPSPVTILILWFLCLQLPSLCSSQNLSIPQKHPCTAMAAVPSFLPLLLFFSFLATHNSSHLNSLHHNPTAHSTPPANSQNHNQPVLLLSQFFSSGSYNINHNRWLSKSSPNPSISIPAIQVINNNYKFTKESNHRSPAVTHGLILASISIDLKLLCQLPKITKHRRLSRRDHHRAHQHRRASRPLLVCSLALLRQNRSCPSKTASISLFTTAPP